jgi:hypothetical protein
LDAGGWIQARVPDWDGYAQDDQIIKLEPEFCGMLKTATPMGRPVSLDDFRAHMPDHRYIFVPTRDLWPATSVDARLDWPDGPGRIRWL